MKDEKDKYEPPKAMRLDKMSSGSGAECNTGSGDADCLIGYGALGCSSGSSASGSCLTQGEAATGECAYGF